MMNPDDIYQSDKIEIGSAFHISSVRCNCCLYKQTFTLSPNMPPDVMDLFLKLRRSF